MHLYERKERGRTKGYHALLISICMLLLMFFLIWKTSDIVQSKDAELLDNAINRAVVNCYAIEGRYPESLEYLINHYGVIINEETYLVRYEIFASNIKPNVNVIIKGDKMNE